jgi:DNA-binding FrmR family transcriptional regulator
MNHAAAVQAPHNHAIHKACLPRLRRIEGQVRGIARMVEEERYCTDILTQLLAARAALKKVEDEILKGHVEHCVENAVTSGDAAEQRRLVAELLEVFGRFST